MTSPTLTLADELDYLPKVDDISAFSSGGTTRGYCTLAPRRVTGVPDRVQRRFGGDAPSWWRSDRAVENSALHVFYLDEAYLLPATGVIVSADGRVMAASYGEARYLYAALGDLPGVVSGDDQAIRLPCVAAEARFDRAFATMPWGALHNYGHFLLDSLPSVATLRRQFDGSWRFLFPTLKDWHRGHLDLMQVGNRQEVAAEVVYCRDILWTSHMDHHLQRPNRSLDLLREAYAPGRRAGADKIWLSRAGDAKRHFAQDEALEARLAELGFHIVRAQALTPHEQAQTFSSARLVAGFTGAGFANALFCDRDAKIVEIQPSLLQGVWVRNLAVTIGCEWIPYFCGSTPAAQAAVIGGQPRGDIGIEIALDIEDFLRFLVEIAAEA